MQQSVRIAVIYLILALVATAANLGSQWVVLYLLEFEFVVLLSLCVGTGVGLIAKYLLDKRYIFAFKATDISHEGKTFGLYTLMGLLTTVIFWGVELLFAILFESNNMILLGGAIGLSIGYLIKYHLDKRYVFKTDAKV
jgi:putative flippase GtrA